MKIQNLEESRIVRLCIICNDILLIALSYWLSYAYTHGFSVALAFPYSLKIMMILEGLTITCASYMAPPLFIKRIVHGYDIVARVAYLTLIQTAFMLIVIGIVQGIHFMRRELVLCAVLFFIMLCIERILFHQLLTRSRSQGANRRHVLLIGHPWMLEDIYKTLKDKSLGFFIQGIFTRQQLPAGMNIPVLGDRKAAIGYLKAHPEINDVYMVPDPDYEEETMKIFRYCENHMIRFYAMPVLLEFLTKRMELHHIGNTTLLCVRNEPLQSPANRLVKRSFDILVSGLFLLTVFPIIFVIVGIIIKTQSPGPIIFKQKRNGLDGREFYCLKFRSMHVNDDADKLQATENDPRKFKFGDFMRRTNIDELPQFINVFIGNMSLVGPRPHMLMHTQEYSQLIQRYMIRHLVKPGITGWAQAQGFRGETKTLKAMEDRVKADIWYVENWSFPLDLAIMWRTVMNMVKHNEKNAY